MLGRAQTVDHGLRLCAGVKMSNLGDLWYVYFFAVLNSLISLLSIPVVHFLQKCHFDALKLILSNQPKRD